MKFQKDIFESLKVYGFDLSLMMWVKFAWFVVWCLWHLRFSLLFTGKKIFHLICTLSIWYCRYGYHQQCVCFCRILLIVRSYKPVLSILNDRQSPLSHSVVQRVFNLCLTL